MNRFKQYSVASGGAERPSARDEDIAIRCAILACCERHGQVTSSELARVATERIGTRISIHSAANMAAALHRAGFLRYTSVEGLGCGNYHAITSAGRYALRYFDPSRAR